MLSLTKANRLMLGVCILLLVDVIWVSSSELTKFLYQKEHYEKPFFTTYWKMSMFMLYLLGFLFWKPWRDLWKRNPYTYLDPNKEDVEDNFSSNDSSLSDPMYVPVKFNDSDKGSESDDSTLGHKRSVRFSSLSEVRQLSEFQAEDAVLARLSYAATLRAEAAALRAANKLTVKQVAKLACIFCILWFFANFSYQEALKDTEMGVVNILSSMSGLFTLVLAAVFPSNSSDRFTLSKLVAVVLGLSGVVLVSLSDVRFETKLDNPLSFGTLWAVGGALLYALYLVLLKKNVDNEERLDIPMFFGFIGLFNFIIIWPGFFLLHYTNLEPFQWPSKQQWVYIIINGIVGTVLSEFLWLWGCFLTSSLIATLSLCLTIPMSMLIDILLNKISYSWIFFIGSVPIFLAFFAVSILTHYNNCDPVLIGIKRLGQCIFKRRISERIREADLEQTESLIGINSTSDCNGRDDSYT